MSGVLGSLITQQQYTCHHLGDPSFQFRDFDHLAATIEHKLSANSKAEGEDIDLHCHKGIRTVDREL